MSIVRFWLSSALALCLCGTSPGGEIRPDFEMDHDPEIRIPAAVIVFPDRLGSVWLEALARPEADMQRMAADAIARGHEAGVPDLDVAVPRLAELVSGKKPNPALQGAVALALIKLNASQAAPQLADAARRSGADLRHLVEPVLAAWKYDPFIPDWEARLQAPETHHRDLILAVECLGTIGKASAVDKILERVHAPRQRSDVRVVAARAAGLLRDGGLEGDVRGLLATPSAPRLDRLCAALLLTRHAGNDARALLLDLAVDREPAVAVVALKRLIEIDPHLVLPLAEGAMQNADANVRRAGANACVLAPDPQRVVWLSRLLDDPHPAVRGFVRDSLYELAQRAELDEPVRQGAAAMLSSDRWRGLEQAALLLGALDHEPVAGRLVELLEFNRREVRIAAAWGLKKLAVPEVLPAMFDKASRNFHTRPPEPIPAGTDAQTAHLFEAFGRMKFTHAEPLLRQHIPKNAPAGILARKSAIWALGLLHEAVPDESLAQQLLERVADNGPPPAPPELPPVKQMSAVSIGRMKAISQAEALRKFISPVVQPEVLDMSIRWAVMELTGELIPEPEAPKSSKSNWFLEPLDDVGP